MRSLVAVMLLAVTAAAPPPPREEAAALQTRDAKIARDDHDRMTLGVRVGNRGPFAFLVDTGAERTVISRELAGQLRLGAGKALTLQSVLGKRLVETVDIPELQLGARRLAVPDAPSLPSQHLGADGILGLDSLAAQRVAFDFRRRVMSITPSRGAPARLDGTTIVVEARRRYKRLLFTNATLDSHPVVVVLDTGSEISIGNLALQRKLARGRKVQASVAIETVLGEKVVAGVAKVDRLEIDSLTLKDLNIAFIDASIFRRLKIDHKPAMLLGMNAVRAFDTVSVDFATGKVRFVLPGTSKRR